MAKRNRLRNGRLKAPFGIDGAIMAGATLAAAAINAASTANAAKQQADAVSASAQTNADALARQNENNNALQEKSLTFTKEQNEVNRDLQKDIQMNLQILAGQQNANQMREMARTQVKRGGSVRRKLRNSGSFLQGSNGNLPFTVTDGGGVIPVGITPEGYELYEIVGNDHEHYHKAQGGKNKTGVGISFGRGKTIEGEGNQNSNRGEKMLVTPDDAMFISKHNLRDKAITGMSFNPAKAVDAGMHPILAFNIQENIKKINGISDDGKHQSTSPVRRMATSGAGVIVPTVPDLSLDFLAPVATGVVAGTRQLKCGGRHKAAYGYRYGKPPYNNMDWFSTTTNWNGSIGDYNIPTTRSMPMTPTITRPVLNTDIFSNTPISTTKSGRSGRSGMTTSQGNLLGAGINAGANLLAAGIGAIGNTIAARQLAGAYDQAGNMLANAYSRLGGIDMSLLNRRDYRAAHAMAALQAPLINTGAERSAAERSLQRNLAKINRGTLSSAAAQDRSARAEVDYNDRIAQIESNADKLRQGILQENMARITQVANENANRDTQANQAYGQAYLNLLQYNNDIANERITGAAQARADALLQRQSTLANMRATNAQGFANAINTGGNAFGSAFATNAKMQNELEMSRYGWTAENDLNYTIKNADIDNARLLYKRYKGRDGQYAIWAKQLEDAFGRQNLV